MEHISEASSRQEGESIPTGREGLPEEAAYPPEASARAREMADSAIGRGREPETARTPGSATAPLGTRSGSRRRSAPVTVVNRGEPISSCTASPEID